MTRSTSRGVNAKPGSPVTEAEEPGGNQAAGSRIRSQWRAGEGFLSDSPFGVERPAAALEKATPGQG